MSATEHIVNSLESSLRDLRSDANISTPPLEVRDPMELAARIMLSTIVEPGDSTMGVAVSAIGPTRLADALFVAPGIRQPESNRLSKLAQATSEIIECDDSSVTSDRISSALIRWQSRSRLSEVVRAVCNAITVNAKIVMPDDQNWHPGLNDLGQHAPLLLWVRGNTNVIANPHTIALVGARASSGYGDHVTMECAAGLVERGFTVISGGAYGIDEMAHRSALAHGGTTIAYLAGGIDTLTPAGNSELLLEIEANGAVVTELPCEAKPTRWRYLRRNRLIAASSAATVVIEAGHRSGSLNTAGHAAHLGRPLAAVPGPVTSPSSAGCHRMFREYNAICVTNAAEIAELAEPMQTHNRSDDRAQLDGSKASTNQPLLGEEGSMPYRLWGAISSRQEQSLNQLAEATQLESSAVMALIGEWQVENFITQGEQGWRRVART